MRGILFAAVLLASPARADGWPSPWTWTDTGFEAAFLIALGADWAQTRGACPPAVSVPGARRVAPPVCPAELNPLLGSRPSRSAVDRYFAASAAAHALISVALPAGYRRAWQLAWIGIEAGAIAVNYHAGVVIRF